MHTRPEKDYGHDRSSDMLIHCGCPFITGEIVYSLGDHGARKNMRVSDDDIFVGIPAELLSCIVGNLEKMKNL